MKKMKLVTTKYKDGGKSVKKTNAPIATSGDTEKQDNARMLIGQGQKPKKVGQEGYEKDVAERNARLTKFKESSPEAKEKALATSEKARNINQTSSQRISSVIAKEDSAKKAPNKGLDNYVATKQAAEKKYKDDDDKNPNIDRKSAITSINNKSINKKKEGVKKMVLIKKSK